MLAHPNHASQVEASGIPRCTEKKERGESDDGAHPHSNRCLILRNLRDNVPQWSMDARPREGNTREFEGFNKGIEGEWKEE
jgi:hypothetical protein